MWKHPLVIGFFLVLAPPVALAISWSVRGFSRDGRRALTAATVFSTVLLGAIVGVMLGTS